MFIAAAKEFAAVKMTFSSASELCSYTVCCNTACIFTNYAVGEITNATPGAICKQQ